MTHATALRRLILTGLCISTISGFSHANTPASTSNAPRTLAEAAAQGGTSSAGRTDIVARVDSPRVTNILPWQEQQVKKVNLMTISALNSKLFNTLDTVVKNPTQSSGLVEDKKYSGILNEPYDHPSHHPSP